MYVKIFLPFNVNVRISGPPAPMVMWQLIFSQILISTCFVLPIEIKPIAYGPTATHNFITALIKSNVLHGWALVQFHFCNSSILHILLL